MPVLQTPAKGVDHWVGEPLPGGLAALRKAQAEFVCEETRRLDDVPDEPVPRRPNGGQLGWGRPHTPGHYLDLISATLGLVLLLAAGIPTWEACPFWPA